MSEMECRIWPAAYSVLRILIVLVLAFLFPDSSLLRAQCFPTQGGEPDAVELQQRAAFSQTLRELTALGPRLTGSAGAQQSIVWASEAMRSAGLKDVHTEAWTLGQGWQRGSAHLRIVAPLQRDLEAVAYGWTGSTPGEVKGGLLEVAVSSPRRASWRHRILLLDAGTTGKAQENSFFALPELVEKAREMGALAVLVPDLRPGETILHTSPVGFPGVATALPVLAIRPSSAATLRALLRGGTGQTSALVRLSVLVANSFTRRPFAANVVGSLPGTEAASGTLLVGAHLDSWDLSAGASDDAYGVALVLSLGRLLAGCGHPLRRTIRFVLFTGEEEGLLGSSAYVSAHRDELVHLSLAVVVDWGDGPISKLPVAGHSELLGSLRSVLQSTHLADVVQPTPGYLRFTDAFSFTRAGIAGLAPLQDSPDYSRLAHSALDTFAAVRLDTAGRNLQILGTTLQAAADAEEPVAKRWSPAQRHLEFSGLALPSSMLLPALSGLKGSAELRVGTPPGEVPGTAHAEQRAQKTKRR